MPDAIMTGVNKRAAGMVSSLLRDPGPQGALMLEPLAASVSARRNAAELKAVLEYTAQCASPALQAAVLKGINRNIKPVALDKSAKAVLNALIQQQDPAIKGLAMSLAAKLNLGDSKALAALIRKSEEDLNNPVLSTEQHLAAVALLSETQDSSAGRALVNAWRSSSPPVRSAIVDALISHGSRMRLIAEALQTHTIPVSSISQLQAKQLMQRANPPMRAMLEGEFARVTTPDKDALLAKYSAALAKPRDEKQGAVVFQQMCASCHHVNNIGTAVGPDLKNSYGNSDETILRNMLFPNDNIASGYETYVVTTNSGDNYSGVLVSESANSIVLRQIGGVDKTFLRKDIKNISSSASSLMPEFGEALTPQNCADIIGWLRKSLASKN
jgi:putative heme-binding domain-containing protein